MSNEGIPAAINAELDRRDFLKSMGLGGLLGGFGMCSCGGCRSTPITQRKQLLLIPESQENQMGVAAYDEVKKKNRLSSNAKYNAVISRVGQRLAAVSGRPDYQWEFTVIADKTQNAFCLPGGKVAFYEGIIPVCENEAGVAVVMSHEISHALARHGGERMTQQLEANVASKIAQAVFQRGLGTNAQLAMSVYGAAEKGVLLRYSRSQESEADAMGIRIMAQAGYDPNEAPVFWQRFGAANSGQKSIELMSTHPSDERRAADLQQLLPEAQRDYQAAPVKHGLGEQVA